MARSLFTKASTWSFYTVPGIRTKTVPRELLVENKFIIIHHTGTSGATVDQIETSELRQYKHMPYHFIVDKDWSYRKYLELDKNAGSTMNHRWNQRAIQIAMVGNFNNEYPTQAQMSTLNYLIAEIEKKKWPQEITGHKEIDATACPWKNFPWEMLRVETKQREFTRYYSPEPNQKTYLSSTTGYFSKKYQDMYKNYSQGYERDVCMNCGCDINWHQLYDCTKPADGKLLKAEDAYKIIACPPELKLGTKMWFDGLWTVTCRDRGWAIKNNRLDLRVGYGDKWVEEMLKNYNPIKNGYVLN